MRISSCDNGRAQRVCGRGQGLARCLQAPAGNCVTVHCDWRDMHAYLPCVASPRAASVYLPHLSNQGPVIPCALPTHRQRHDALRLQNVRPLHASAGCVCTDLEAHVLLQGSFKAVVKAGWHCHKNLSGCTCIIFKQLNDVAGPEGRDDEQF